jgi:hypothetical protein
MTVLTENEGWGIVWMNERYYIRHLACGSYLRGNTLRGCLCRKLRRDETAIAFGAKPVDPVILKKFILLTKGDIK